MKKGTKYYTINENGILVVMSTGAAYSNTDNSVITSQFTGIVLHAIGPINKTIEVGDQGVYNASEFKELSSNKTLVLNTH